MKGTRNGLLVLGLLAALAPASFAQLDESLPAEGGPAELGSEPQLTGTGNPGATLVDTPAGAVTPVLAAVDTPADTTPRTATALGAPVAETTPGPAAANPAATTLDGARTASFEPSAGTPRMLNEQEMLTYARGTAPGNLSRLALPTQESIQQRQLDANIAQIRNGQNGALQAATTAGTFLPGVGPGFAVTGATAAALDGDGQGVGRSLAAGAGRYTTGPMKVFTSGMRALW